MGEQEVLLLWAAIYFSYTCIFCGVALAELKLEVLLALVQFYETTRSSITTNPPSVLPSQYFSSVLDFVYNYTCCSMHGICALGLRIL
jgi:hypothetical protein